MDNVDWDDGFGGCYLNTNGEEVRIDSDFSDEEEGEYRSLQRFSSWLTKRADEIDNEALAKLPTQATMDWLSQCSAVTKQQSLCSHKLRILIETNQKRLSKTRHG